MTLQCTRFKPYGVMQQSSSHAFRYRCCNQRPRCVRPQASRQNIETLLRGIGLDRIIQNDTQNPIDCWRSRHHARTFPANAP